MTEEELHRAAAEWLAQVGCQIVMSEQFMPVSTGELIETIGWRYSTSILVKTYIDAESMLADGVLVARKRPHIGVGDWRVILTTIDTIRIDQIPPGWCLMEFGKDQYRYKAGFPNDEDWNTPPFKANKELEVQLLCAEIGRVSELVAQTNPEHRSRKRQAGHLNIRRHSTQQT